MHEGVFVEAGVHADIAVVVVTYNSADHIGSLIGDLRRDAARVPIRLIVVDNDSSDDTVRLVEAEHDVVLVRSGGNLGYAGGINRARTHVQPCDSVLIINPDLRLRNGALGAMQTALRQSGVGAVVPLMADEHGEVYPSQRMEPSLLGALGDVAFGRFWPGRPQLLSENVRPQAKYETGRDVDWATGAVLLIDADVATKVGDWDERYFLYSEETDYCRRIRDHGNRIWFEPSAVTEHIGGGSGTSPALSALMAVNKVRYVESVHRRAYAAGYRAAVALAEFRRSGDKTHRENLAMVLNREKWDELPKATHRIETTAMGSGSIVIPAHNEAAVITNTLAPLSDPACSGALEVIVACNGCTDATADVARSVPGIKVLEIDEASKTAALNAGDDAATLWPRLYLDADIRISPRAVADVFDVLRSGDALAARPVYKFDTAGASAPVRGYYRARSRIPHFREALWGAGAYALSEAGHKRMGRFPSLVADDLWIAQQFDPSEMTVVETDPALVATPRDSRSLTKVLRRVYRGSSEIPDSKSAGQSLKSLIGGVRGPRSAADAAVYASFALAGRRQSRQPVRWERDESSRR